MPDKEELEATRVAVPVDVNATAEWRCCSTASNAIKIKTDGRNMVRVEDKT